MAVNGLARALLRSSAKAPASPTLTDPPACRHRRLRAAKILRGMRLWQHWQAAQVRASATQESLGATIASLTFSILALIHYLACMLWAIGRAAHEKRKVGGAAWFDSYSGLHTSDLYVHGRVGDQYLVSFFWVAEARPAACRVAARRGLAEAAA